ncbi:28S ribosomal protein S29 [Tropilaelaps mercedesae]|uniref:Small ribosomal subunit protein mS29 n=1 Tax=Tropilaelaps mercedesae TaxID=418985 RepID=A0A1V9XIU9_9ACAR|nr:28S ribosomal protein S29 [Tropilaelaps mercedesae]
MAAPIVRARLSHLGAFQLGSWSGCVPVRKTSVQTAAAVQTQSEGTPDTGAPQTPPPYRTLITDPTKHTTDHIGKFYKVPNAVQTGLFNVFQLTKIIRQIHILTGEFSIMVRSPFLEVRDYLKSYDYSQPALRVMLYGRLGTGKTQTMAHLLHYAYVNDWLIITHHWLPQYVRMPKELQPNETNPLLMDSPIDAAIWLQHFRVLNLNLLSRLNLTTDQEWKWSETETTAKGEPLTNIIEHGIKRVKHACQCVEALLLEIKAHTDAGKVKTFVAMEAVNTIWDTSFMKRPDKSFIPVKDYTLLRAFKHVLANDWKNAAIVVTVDETGLTLKHRGFTLENVPSYTPRYLLGSKGFEFFEPFVPVRTENYNDKEFESALDFYIATNFIQHPKAKTESAREEFKFLSGKHPRSFVKICQWI